MIAAALVTSLGAFCVIGILPLAYFRRGSFNGRWWATAVPFFLAPLAVLAVAVGWLPAAVDAGAARQVLAATSLLPSLLGIALIERTARAHRARPALWHQEDDEPVRIVREGPYRRIRHPFYSAFLLISAGAALAAPHWATWAAFGYTSISLNVTAAREERRLLASRHGDVYRDYMAAAGRFLPRPLGVS
jgi:protein-S-isoprenylcysteine O-methyltransferase Ste14